MPRLGEPGLHEPRVGLVELLVRPLQRADRVLAPRNVDDRDARVRVGESVLRGQVALHLERKGLRIEVDADAEDLLVDDLLAVDPTQRPESTDVVLQRLQAVRDGVAAADSLARRLIDAA